MAETKDDYWYNIEDIQARAIENLNKTKQFNKLYEQLRRTGPADFVKRSQLTAKIQQMKQQEVLRLTSLAEKRRMNVDILADTLKRSNPADGDRFQELMTGMQFLLDMLDFTFVDVNDILRHNNTGIQIHNFPEIVACRKMVNELLGKDMSKMLKYKSDLWMDESDRLWEHMKERCAVFRRKVERFESKLKDKPNEV